MDPMTIIAAISAGVPVARALYSFVIEAADRIKNAGGEVPPSWEDFIAKANSVAGLEPVTDPNLPSTWPPPDDWDPPEGYEWLKD